VRRADHSSREVLLNVMCLSVMVKYQQREDLGQLGIVEPWETIDIVEH